MSAARTPDELLGELGASLQDAWAADGRSARRAPRLRLRGRRLRRRSLVALLAGALVLVPTAVATRDALWAPDPPPLPAQLRPRDAVAPGAAGTPVYVATGSEDGVAFRLSATACRYGTVSAVGLFLTVPGGGAGARCDVATTRQPGLSPRALAARRVQTYYDPASRTTWAFGVLPAAARTVTLTTSAYGGGDTRVDRIDARAVDPRAIQQGHLPGGLRVFVTALAGGRAVAGVEAQDDAGATVLRCTDGRCGR